MDEIEPYKGAAVPAASGDPILMLAQAVLETRSEQLRTASLVERHSAELQALKTTAVEHMGWLRLRVFVQRYKVRYPYGALVPTDNETMSKIGAHAAKWCGDSGIVLRRAADADFGTVRKYPLAGLGRYFKETGLQFDERQWEEDVRAADAW